jgi:hypothetical protein
MRKSTSIDSLADRRGEIRLGLQIIAEDDAEVAADPRQLRQFGFG